MTVGAHFAESAKAVKAPPYVEVPLQALLRDDIKDQDGMDPDKTPSMLGWCYECLGDEAAPTHLYEAVEVISSVAVMIVMKRYCPFPPANSTHLHVDVPGASPAKSPKPSTPKP